MTYHSKRRPHQNVASQMRLPLFRHHAFDKLRAGGLWLSSSDFEKSN